MLATVSASGTVEPARNLGLNFTTGGKVVAIDVQTGQRVSAGQMLARVSATSSRQTLAEAKASLAAARAALTAAEQGEMPAQRAAANAQAVSAKAQVQSARSSLAHERQVVAVNKESLRQQVSAAQSTLTAGPGRQREDVAAARLGGPSRTAAPARRRAGAPRPARRPAVLACPA